MSSVTIIFPNQLFKNHPALHPGRQVYLAEEWLFFQQYNFHKHKLVLHRSSMKFYEEYLTGKNYKVTYIDTTDARNDVRELIKALHQKQITILHIADVADNWLRKSIVNAAAKYSMEIIWYVSPGFLNTMDGVADYFNKKKTYFQTDFYIYQRKQRKILLEISNQPKGANGPLMRRIA